MTKKTAKNPKGAGRKRIEFSERQWQQIENACAIQCTAEEIASFMGVSVDTLERRITEGYGIKFAEYYKKHSAGGKMSLRRLQYRAAENGSVPMLIWLGKQYLGQSDKQEVSATVDLDGKIQDLIDRLPN